MFARWMTIGTLRVFTVTVVPSSVTSPSYVCPSVVLTTPGLACSSAASRRSTAQPHNTPIGVFKRCSSGTSDELIVRRLKIGGNFRFAGRQTDAQSCGCVEDVDVVVVAEIGRASCRGGG